MARILIDLYMLKYPHCGFGQIAWNYARFFKETYIPDPNLEITLLVPRKYVGAFGNKVRYEAASPLKKLFPRLFKHYDLWHSTDQIPRFRPASKDTIYVITIHDFNYEYEKTGTPLLHARKRLRKYVDRANHLIYISHFAATDGQRFCPRPELPHRVIMNGVEDLTRKPESCPAGIDPNHPFFFTIGEVRAKKNFHVLLDVMKSFPEYQLYIAGSHPTDYAAQIQARIEHENISNAHLIGRVSDPERVWLYRHCSAFVFPSLFEGFGLPVIEAMQFGRPVFSSNKTSLKEIGGECAYFWDNFETSYMCEVLRKGLKDFEEHPERDEANRAYAATFSYERNLNAIANCYRELLSQKSR
ncbi:MAG: glycosyltransferase family 4 protein [Paludibacteraceae bacterium]|nr:glycosyltransferase family 4 protein [Paludibacteraceae bacterium]